VQWTFENIAVNEDSSPSELRHLADFLSRKQFDLVINLPMRNGGARRVSNFMTHGYRTRRLAVDYSVPLITDVKCAKLLVEVSNCNLVPQEYRMRDLPIARARTRAPTRARTLIPVIEYLD